MSTSTIDNEYVPPRITSSGSAALTGQIASASIQHKLYREKLRSEKLLNRRLTVVCFVVSILGIITAGLAMIIESSSIIYLAFVLPLLSGPYVILQRRTINKMPTLKAAQNHTRLVISELAQQNVQLRQENDRLAMQASRLTSVTERFENLIRRHGGDVDEMKKIVREHGETLRELKRLAEATKLQSLFQTLLRPDINGDYQFSEDELDALIFRIQCFTTRKVDEQRLREIFRGGPTTFGRGYQEASDMFDTDSNNAYYEDPSEYEVFNFPKRSVGGIV